MRVKDVMTTEVLCCTPSDIAQAAAKIMKAHKVGAVPVISDTTSRRLEGIVTDRDLCRAVVADGMAPDGVMVRKYTTRGPVTCECPC